MAYLRVLPRDLFNEGNLLKCMGRLWIILDETHGHAAKFETEDCDGFDIVQDPNSGAIYARGVVFTVHKTPLLLTRPLNSRNEWPLYAENEDSSVAVFDDAGNLSEEMRAFIGLGD